MCLSVPLNIEEGYPHGTRKRFFCFSPEVGGKEVCVNIAHVTDVRFWADDYATIHVVADDVDIRVEGAENVRALRAWIAAWNTQEVNYG